MLGGDLKNRLLLLLLNRIVWVDPFGKFVILLVFISREPTFKDLLFLPIDIIGFCVLVVFPDLCHSTTLCNESFYIMEEQFFN